MKSKHISVAAACAAAALLAAGCGGSGTPAAAGAAPTLTGTAATGAAFDGAAITVTDQSGAVVGTGTSAADGSYTVTLAADATGPFVVQAVRDDQTLVSVAPPDGGVVNITPITHLIAARLSASGDPTRLAAEVQANPGQLTPAAIESKVDEVVAVLRPLLDAVGVTDNPLTGPFTADGQGADRVLDSLAITITPASATTSNIEVVVKQTMAEDEEPTPIQFTSASATLPALPPVAAANLVKPGTATLVADLLARMTACYALPVADRVHVPDTNGQSAAGIKAAACKDIFHGGDPSTFKSNGRVVGSTPGNAFANIFRSSADNLVFDRGTYEFSRPNGDLVIGYRGTDAQGNSSQDTFVVRPDNAAAPTRLAQIGNQYDYDGGVKAYHQLRTFVNQPDSDYLSTGYAFSVANTLGAGGASIFNRVVVTSPKGRQFTLKPRSGFTTLQLTRPATVTGSSYLRLRSVYTSPARAGDNPADADVQQFFATTPSTDAEIAGFGQRGVWKFDYFLAGNATATPDATQHFRTRARALSIGELKQQAMAELTPAALAQLQSQSSASGHAAVPTAGYSLAWTVDPAALPPTTLAVWGFRPNASMVPVPFNDSRTVGSTARSATVPCVKKSASDMHCTGSVENVPSSYAAGSRLNGLHLFARDAGGREYSHFYATYGIGSSED